jgi:hypothetical protein
LRGARSHQQSHGENRRRARETPVHLTSLPPGSRVRRRTLPHAAARAGD